MITFEELLIEDALIEGFSNGKEEGKLEGKKEGRLEARENEVYRRIVKEGLSDEQIVDYAEVPLKFVRKVRRSIECKKTTL